MLVLDLEASAAIPPCLPVLTAGAWLVRQRADGSGWGHAVWAFSAGPVGANYFFKRLGCLAYPVIAIRGADPLHPLRTEMFFPLPSQEGVVT